MSLTPQLHAIRVDYFNVRTPLQLNAGFVSVSVTFADL